PEVMMTLLLQVPLCLGILHLHKLLYFFHPGRRVIIVDVGIVPRKALGAEQFCVIERPVWFAELCMPLVGYFPQAMKRWHVFLLLKWLRATARVSSPHPLFSRPYAVVAQGDRKGLLPSSSPLPPLQ